MEVVKFITDPEADEDPRVELPKVLIITGLITRWYRSFYVAQDGVQKIADLFN